MSFQRVLAAVDFSRDSVTGVRAAAEAARLYSAALLIFHSIEAEPDAAGATLELMEKARAAMEALIENLGPLLDGVEHTTEIASGWPEEAIVDRAREWKADLVVLGAKGIAMPEDALLGGIAGGVVERAPCSVLAVRGSHRETSRR